MASGLVRIPDYSQAVTGYRLWRFPEAQVERLHSLSQRLRDLYRVEVVVQPFRKRRPRLPDGRQALT